MALRITERDAHGVGVLILEGRIVLGGERLVPPESEKPARRWQEKNCTGRCKRQLYRQRWSRHAGGDVSCLPLAGRHAEASRPRSKFQ